MKCPIDGETLVMSERHGVEIDYCPKCRGVWLDRGELDKIIDKATGEMTLAEPPRDEAAPEPTPRPAPEPAPERRPDPRRDAASEPRVWQEPYREYDRDPEPRYNKGKRYRDDDDDDRWRKRRKWKKRKSILSEIFDFD